MDGTLPEKCADRPFDPSKTAASESLRALLTSASARLSEAEARDRRRTPSNQATFDMTVAALVSDLVHRHLEAPTGRLMVPLAKSNLAPSVRAAPFMTEAFADTVKQLAATGIAELDVGRRTEFGSQQSTIKAGPWLMDRLEPGDFDFGDIGRDPRLLGDPLVLRSPKVRGQATNMPLPDNQEVHRLRAEMHEINAWLSQADIAWLGEPIDTGRRHLYRIFNDGSLHSGGRLYHGFWQDLGRLTRLEHLRIGGQSVASLDFAQMAMRLAYGIVAKMPPEGDLYAIPGIRSREGAKRVLNALLASECPLRRFPAGTRQFFPARERFASVVESIARHHPALVPLFGSAQALRFQHYESRVIVAALLKLKEMEVVALPVHDSVLVARVSSSVAKEVLETTFSQITGVHGTVEVETYPPEGNCPSPHKKGG